MPDTPLLDQVHLPADTRGFDIPQLRQLADELRAETIDAVSVTGGHLGAGLGVVELTVALHHVFETPKDILIWDVGHQCYPHKILTGRRDRIRTLRQPGGLSGFTKRSESEYDPFGAAHASTSISAALGFAAARDQKGEKNRVVAVIGDGSMSAGMAYEAMNNAAETTNGQLMVILNDNDMSIAPPVGGMSAYLAKQVSGGAYRNFRRFGKSVAEHLPRPFRNAARKAEEYARGMIVGGTFFEELGFYYVGPVDGHDMDNLVPILKNAAAITDRPVVVHVVTQKGKGYAPAESSADKLHAVAKFDVISGKQAKAASNGSPDDRLDWAQRYAELLEMAELVEPLVSEVFAQAHAYAEQGNKIEGWGLQAKPEGNRKWAVEQRLLKLFFKRHRVKLDEWAERKVKSPAQIEKLLKARDIALPKHYVERAPSSGTSLKRTEKITRPTRSVPERLADLSQKLLGAVTR